MKKEIKTQLKEEKLDGKKLVTELVVHLEDGREVGREKRVYEVQEKQPEKKPSKSAKDIVLGALQGAEKLV